MHGESLIPQPLNGLDRHGAGRSPDYCRLLPNPTKIPPRPAAPPTLNTPFVHHRETTPIRAFLLSLVVQRVHPMERTLSHPTILTAKAQEDT